MDRNYLSPSFVPFGCGPPNVNRVEAAQHVTQMLNDLNSSRGLKPPMFGISPQVSTSPQMATEPHGGKRPPCNATRFGWQDSFKHMISLSFDAMMYHPLAGLRQNTPFEGSRFPSWAPKISGFAANNPPALLQPFIPTGMNNSQIQPSNNSTYHIPNQPFLSLYGYPQSQYESCMMDSFYFNCSAPPKNFPLPLKKSYKLNPEAAEYIPKTMTFANHQCQSVPQSVSRVSDDPSSVLPTTGHCSDSLIHNQWSPPALSHHQLQAESECLSPSGSGSNCLSSENIQSDSTENSPSKCRADSNRACKDLDSGVALLNEDSCTGATQEELVSMPLSLTTVAHSDPRRCDKEELFMPVSCDAPSFELTVKEPPKSKMETSVPTSSSHFVATGDDATLELLCGGGDDCSSSYSSSVTTSSSDEHFSNSSYSDKDNSSTSFDEETDGDDNDFDVFFQHDVPCASVLTQGRGEDRQQRSRPSNCATNPCQVDVPCALVLTKVSGTSSSSVTTSSSDEHFSNSSYSDKDNSSTSFDEETDGDDNDFDVFFQHDVPCDLVLTQSRGEDRQQRSRPSNCATNPCQVDVPCALVLTKVSGTSSSSSDEHFSNSSYSDNDNSSTSFDEETDSDDSDSDVFFQHDVACDLVLTKGPREDQQERSRPSNCATNFHKVESTTNHENTKKNAAPSPQQPGWSILSYILETTSLSEDSAENEDDWPEDDSNYECELFNLELDDSWQNPLGGLVISQLCPGKNIDTVDVSSKSDKGEVQPDTNVNHGRECWHERIPTRVRFSDEVETHVVENWDRGGEWEQHARDRMRFQARIEEVESILAPILDPAHRWQVFCKLKQS